MFPEIRQVLGRFFADRSGLVSLNLKETIAFSTTELDYLKKFPPLYAALTGGGPSWSGETVSVTTALQNSVVWACRGIVAGTMGYLPTTVMQERGGAKREATELPIFNAMKWEPNEEISSSDFRELLTSHCLFTGGGFAQIIRRSGSGTALELRQLLPYQVLPDREKTGQRRLVYIVKLPGEADKTFTVESGKPHDILHLRGPGWDGVKGFDTIAYGKQAIGSAIAAERNVASFWANGGRRPYHLEIPAGFKDADDFEEFRKNWEKVYNNPNKAPIMEGGNKYVEDGSTMRDAQAIEFRQNAVSELCRWFDVSPHLVGDLSRATYSNIEEKALEFEKFTLSKWLRRWNSDFHRCVLTPNEKENGYYLHHNLDALRRGDFVARMMGYAAALQNGWMNRDEVRALEDRNPIPDGAGSDYTIQLNMQALPIDAAAELAKQQARTASRKKGDFQ